jgi:tRNA threonylcarbamoyladenosine biosynthesis protein TsaB
VIVLAIDTSTPATVAGLSLNDGSVLEARDDPRQGERPGHATRLLPLACELLSQAGLRWSEIERIAVGIGPGTFTGLRIGVSSARGLAQSLDLPLVGVSSLRVLARPALARAEDTELDDELDGAIALIDARRGEAFAAVYRRSGEELLAPTVMAPDDLAQLPDRVGIDVATQRLLAVGDGAVRYRDRLRAAGVQIPPEDSPLHRVSATALCALAQSATPGDPWSVAPDYLRRPDAELALEEARSP